MPKSANTRILLGIGFMSVLLFLAVPVQAQTAQRAVIAQRTVRVEEPGDGAHHFMLPPINLDVIKAFSDRVAGSERYALTREPAELVVFIICIDSSKDDRIPEGDFCTYTFEYNAKKAPEFNILLGTPTPIVGFRASEIAESIYRAFLEETTETKLSVAELEATFRVANFCSKPANQVPCSGKFE
jgi:hypothetical protein